jgi:hypothetical protein
MSLRDEYRYDETFKKHFLEQVLDTPKFKAFYLKAPGLGRMESCLIMFSPEGINILGDLCPGNDSRNSGVHAYGYGLEWFAGNLSWSYLCEKFLSKEWHKELAEEDCRRIADEIMMGDTSRFDRDRDLEELVEERETLASDLRDLLDDRRRRLAERKDVKDASAVIRARGRILKESIMERRREHAKKYTHLASELDGGEMGVETFGRAMHEIDGDFWEHSPGYGYHPRCRYLLVAIQKKFSELYHAMKASCPVGEA